MSIQEMKQAARAMPPDERAEFMAWLDHQYREQETGETEQPEKPVTFDDIKHLLGKGKGPGDLSTNPKYMDDFGQSSMR